MTTLIAPLAAPDSLEQLARSFRVDVRFLTRKAMRVAVIIVLARAGAHPAVGA